MRSMKKIYSLSILLVGVLFVSSDALAQYCTPRTSSTWGGISRVTTTGGTSNISKITSATTGVRNYTNSDSISVGYGQTFKIQVSFTRGIACFIDWNDDGDFADAGEKIGNTTGTSSATQNNTFTVTVPNSAASGQLRMRLYSLYPYYMGIGRDPRGCGYSSYQGEVEDYRLFIPEPFSNDAGIAALLPDAACAGNSDVKVSIINSGKNTLNSVIVSGTIKEIGGATTSYGPTTISQALPRLGTYLHTVTNYNFGVGKSYDLKFWTSTPNGVPDSSAADDTISKIGFKPAMGGTYTIGSSAGKSFSSITAAEAAMAVAGICSPVIFNLEQGTYKEQVKFTKYLGISASNNVRFRPDPANTAGVNWEFSSTSAVDGQRGTAVFDGAQYISVDSINIINKGFSSGCAIELVNSPSYLSFTGDSLKAQSSTSSNLNVVRNYRGYGQYITLRNNVMIGGTHGIYSYGRSTSQQNTGWVIEDNKVLDYGVYGIYMYYHKDTEINRNEIRIKSGNRYGYGVYAYYSYTMNFNSNKINLDVSGYGYGLFFYYCRATNSNRKTISNNMVAITGGTGYHYPARFYYCDYNVIDFNSFSIEKGNGYGLYLYYGNGVFFRNNVIANFGTYYAYYQRGSQTMSHNAYWAPNGARTYGSLGSALVNVDPKFKSFSDLHSKSTGLYDNGQNFASITTDIDGEARCPSAGCPGGSANPDRGADEYWIPDYDISPKTAGLTPCSGVQNISIMVSNEGFKTLTSFTVNWTEAGVAQTPLVVSTSNVAPGADTLVTLGTSSFTNGVANSFQFITSLPSARADQIPLNDTLQLVIKPSFSGTFTVGNGRDYGNLTDGIKDLTDLGICGPVTFLLDDTTFVENVTIGSIPGSSMSNTLRITSNPANQNLALVEGNQTVGDISYLRLDNIQFISKSGRTIHLKGRNDNVTIDSNIIKGGNISSGECIYDERGANTTNAYIRDNEISNSYAGIYLYGGGTARSDRDENIWIERNTFTNLGVYGIYTFYTLNCHYNDNHFETRTSGSQYMMFNYYNNNSEWRQNTLNMRSNGFQYGIRDYYGNYYNSISTDSNIIENNFISFSNDNATSTQYGIYLYRNRNYHVLHNNVRTNTSGTNYGIYSSYVYGGNGSKVANNIIEKVRGGGFTYYLNRSYGAVSRNHNAYWTGTAGNWGTSGFTRGANSLNTNPRFKIPFKADLRVNSVELDSSASNVGVTVDYFDSPRNVPFHDIGAHEFTPCYYDGGMINVSSIYNSVPTGQSVYVYGSAGNRGLDTITGTRVNALVAGVTSNTLIGSLVPDKDTTVAVLASVGNIAGKITANFFTTINESDCDSTNDSLNLVINVNDSIYALDDSLRGFTGGLGYRTGTTGEFGNVYEVFSADKITSGTFYLSNPIRGASVKLKLYAVNDTANPAVQQLIDSTRAFQVGANGTGWYTLEFGCGGSLLQPGKYLIAIQQINPVNMSLGYSSIRTNRLGIMYSRGTGGAWTDLSIQGGQVGNATLILRANFGEIADRKILADTTLLCFGSTAQIKPNKEYKFQTWSTGQFFDSIKVTQPGIISVRVEDAIGCIYIDTTNVVRTQQIGLSDVVTNAACDSSNGIAVAMATGVYAPYTYSWSNGVVGNTITGVPGDVYMVTATDSVGCSEELEVEVLGAKPIVALSSTYPTCNGDNDGSAEVAITKGIPGYIYNWSSGGSNAKETNLTSGSYTVTVTDKSNCAEIVTVIVTDPPAIQVVMKDVAPSACKLANGTAEAAVAGGIAPFKYFWSNAQTTGKAVGLTEGVYDVTITDSLGCVKTGKVKVLDPNSPISVPSNLALDCSYDTTTAEVTINGGTGPFSYSWSNGSSATKLSGMSKGAYQLRVVDAAGCDHDTTVVITAPDAINVSFSNIVDGGQGNVEATASAIGGTKPYSSYLWSNNETDSTATNLPNGVNTVTVVDANGCSFTAQIDIYSEFTGIGVLGNTDAFRIYPNPTTGVINLEFNLTSEEDVTVRVMNAVGQVIETTSQTKLTQDNVTLDITGYASGIYFVETTVGTEKVVSRIQLSK